MLAYNRTWFSKKKDIADYFWRGVNDFADRWICVPPFKSSLATLALISGLKVVRFNCFVF